MAKVFEIKKFGGINRDTSTIDRNSASADVNRDFEIDPSGRLVKRDGYALKYANCAQSFGYTTPVANRIVNASDIVIANNFTWNSHRRKTVLVGSNGGSTYVFAGRLNYLVSSKVLSLILHRGVEGADGEITWKTTTSTNAVGKLTLSASVLDFGGNSAAPGSHNDQDWLDYSMVLDSANDTIYVALVKRNDGDATSGENKSVLSVLKITNIYNATWSSAGTPAWAEVQEVENIDTGGANADDAIQSVDLEIDGAGFLHLIYEYYDEGDDKYYIYTRKSNVTAENMSGFGGVAILTESGGDMHAPVIVTTPGGDGGASETIYIAYMLNAATDKINYRSYAANSNPAAGAGSPTSLATSPVVTGTGATSSLKSWCGCALAVATGGDLHFLYRTTITNLLHVYIPSGGSESAVTVNDRSGLPTAAYDATYGAPTMNFTCWDLVVKNTHAWIYFSDSGSPAIGLASQNLARVMLKQRKGSANFASLVVPDSVEQINATNEHHAFYATYRREESDCKRRFNYIHADATNRYFKYLRSGRSLSEGSFTIESMIEYDMPQIDGAPIQTIVIQTSENRFYKRNDDLPEWMLLEGTMNIINSAEGWYDRMKATIANGGLSYTAAPNPDDHARFYVRKGKLRAMMGLGQAQGGMAYQMIDRYYFTNDVEHRYRGYQMDVNPFLTPPSSDNLQAGANTATRAVTAIYNGHLVGQGAGGTAELTDDPDHVLSDDYRPFGLKTTIQTNPESDVDFEPVENLHILAEGEMKAFYVALSFIYDGSQESQLFQIPSGNISINTQDGYNLDPYISIPLNAVWVGWVQDRQRNIGGPKNRPYLALQLQMQSWNSTDVDRANLRITSIRVWLGELLTPKQSIEETVFHPAKEVIVAQKNQFKDEKHFGESEWAWSAPNFIATTIIDMNDYLASQASGSYSMINGHSYIDFKREAEKGFTLSPFPESVKYVTMFDDMPVMAGVRIDAKDHPDTVLFPAIRSEQGFSNIMPDVLPDRVQFDFPIVGIERIDDQTALFIGSAGETVKYNILQRAVIERGTGQVGAVAPDSIKRVDVGYSKTMYVADKKLWLHDRFNPKSIGEAIESDSDDSTPFKGLTDLTTTSDAWTFHLSKLQKTILIFPTENLAFVFDWLRKAWSDVGFVDVRSDTFACGTEGIDGELFFSDGENVFTYPSGTTDNTASIVPIWRSADREMPDNADVDLERMLVTYKLTAITGSPTLKISLIRDRGQLTDHVETFPASSTITRVKRNIDFGTKVRRELAVKIEVNSPLSVGAMEIESITIDGIALEQI